MLNIFGSLEASKRAMQTHLKSILTTSHNISNANNPGYSRQEALLRSSNPSKIAEGWLGNGVEVMEIRRMYDQFTNTQIMNENSELNDWDIKKNTLGFIENIFNDSSSGGFNDTFDKFWNSWQSLSNNPEDSASRVNVKEWGKTLASRFNSMASKFLDKAENLDENLVANVEKINSLTSEIVNLNKQAIELSANGEANDLLDQIDIKLEELSKLADIKVEKQDNGNINVSLSNGLLTDGVNRRILNTQTMGGSAYQEIIWEDSGTSVSIQSGEIKGIIDSRDTIISYYKDKLDEMAATLITEVNTLHRDGMGMDGSSRITGAIDFTGTFAAGGSFEINNVTINVNAGDDLDDLITNINSETASTNVVASRNGDKLVLEPDAGTDAIIKITNDPDDIMFDIGITSNFFSGTSASDIEIDTVILNDTSKIAASVSGAPGDNANALNIYGLKDSLLLDSGTATFVNFYSGLIGTLGIESQEASSYSDSQSILLEQLEAHKQSFVGVSLDEELANMVMYQNAYQASAKVIGIIDEMLETLINL